MKELSVRDPELLRWVQAWTGCGLTYASSLLAATARYLEGAVSVDEIDRLEETRSGINSGRVV